VVLIQHIILTGLVTDIFTRAVEAKGHYFVWKSLLSL
jgi:hypothetical protein